MLIGTCLVLLALVLLVVHLGAAAPRLNREDRLAALFLGSTKSLATGLPKASTLFPKDQLALIVLSPMPYHLLSLAVLAVYSRRVVDKLASGEPLHPMPMAPLPKGHSTLAEGL